MVEKGEFEMRGDVMKNCLTCRWVGCKNYGRNLSSCEKYIISLEEERRLLIEEKARTDIKTNDTEYNRGLKAIRDFGYRNVSTQSEVKYWCMCNNL